MSDNNTLRTNILTALDEWMRLDAAQYEAKITYIVDALRKQTGIPEIIAKIDYLN